VKERHGTTIFLHRKLRKGLTVVFNSRDGKLPVITVCNHWPQKQNKKYKLFWSFK
jgi:hypothetical protein